MLEPVYLDESGACVGGSGDPAAAEVLWCRQMPQRAFAHGALAALPALRYVHSDPIGLDHLALDGFVAREIMLTNGTGTPSRPVAEWVMLGLLAWAKSYPHFVRASDAARWDRTASLTELAGKRVLLIGLGSIGTLVAAMLMPFDVEVVAVVERSREAFPDNVSRLVIGPAWRDELGCADAVVLAIPATTATVGMFDAATFARCKPGACFVNVSRGSLVDEEALADALERGQIGFAALDAFHTEPLPATSRLWGRANAIVTPHYTWHSDTIVARMEALFCANLERFVRGEPLVNSVDIAYELARAPRG